MDCIIAIANGIAYRINNQPNIAYFSVTGVAVDCSTLEVTLSFGDPVETLTENVNVGPSGGWSAEFDISAAGLACSPYPIAIDVTVACTDDADCSVSTKFDNYVCQTRDTCPVFDKIAAIATSNAEGGCNDQDEREVTLRATLVGNVPGDLPVFAQFCLRNLETEEQTFLNADQLEPQVEFESSTSLPGGTYMYQLKIISPQPCPGPLGILQVAACGDTDEPSLCPMVTFGDETISAACTPSGQRTVTLSATVTPEPGHPVDAELRVVSGDTDFGELDSGADITGETVLAGTRPLPPGDYTAVVDVTSPAACNLSAAEFTVDPCDAGEEPDKIPIDPPTDEPDENGNGGHDPVIPDPPEPQQPGGINWCLILFWIGFALFVVGALAVGIGYCAMGLGVHPVWVGIWAVIVNVGMVLLILGAILLTIWIFLCGACRINCDALKFFRDMLIILDVVFAVLAAVGGALIALSPLCWIGWLIDTGFTSYLLLLAHFWVFFTGCEEYSDWWPEWLQFEMPDSMRAHCGIDR